MGAGFMDEQGPEQDIYSGKTPEEVLMIMSTRSDYWFNLAKGLPKLYAAGFDRNTLEEKINVDAARQNVWTVSAEVFRSLQVCLQFIQTVICCFSSIILYSC